MSESSAGPLAKLGRWFTQSRQLVEQHREIGRLRCEIERLQARNARMEQAMRRCVPCEYRLAVVGGGKGSEPGAGRASR